jgi:hypothetical protein
MRAKTFVKTGPAVILVLLALATVRPANADTLTETNTTVDGTSVGVDIGRGETFTCSVSANQFSCFAGTFICYGWGNCSALDATRGVPTLADFVDEFGDSPVQFIDTGEPVGTPEPGMLVLLCAGLMGLALRKRRLSPEVTK